MRLLVMLMAMLAAGAAIIAWSAGGSEGSSDEAEAPKTLGVGEVRAGSVAALAQCSDWSEGTVAQRRATVEDIHNQLNQAGADGPTPDLPPDDAYALFERACSQGYAAGFRLYKLYARSAAFSVLVE